MVRGSFLGSIIFFQSKNSSWGLSRDFLYALGQVPYEKGIR